MESGVGRRAEFVGTLTKGLDAYDRQWLDEIAVRTSICFITHRLDFSAHTLLGDDAANETHKKLWEAQVTARKDARRITALEREVTYLRALVECEDKVTQTTPLLDVARNPLTLDSHTVFAHEHTYSGLVTPEMFKQLQQQHICLQQDYANLASAHKTVANRCRKLWKLARAWQAYTNERSLGHEKHTTQDSAHNSKTDVSSQTNRVIRGSSAPASVSSVGQGALPSIQDTVRITESNVSERSRGGSYDKIKFQTPASMGEHIYDFTSGLENDTAVTRDDTDDTGLPEQFGDMESDPLQLTAVPERREDSSPILLSTRAVKRKRYRGTSPTNAIPRIHQTHETLPGTAEKPVHIKSDQSSSSPSAIVRSHSMGEHDDMDLDEVGNKTPTPRKRRRTDTVPFPFAMCWSSSPTNGQEAVSTQPAENHTASGQVDRKPFREQSRNPSPSSTFHAEICRRVGEDHAALPQKDQQERCRQRGELRKGEDPKIPQHIGDKPRRKQSFLFNQAVRHKCAQEKIGNSMFSVNTKSTDVVPTSAVHHGQCAGPELATPGITSGFTEPKRKPDSNGDVKAQPGSAPILRPADPNLLPRTSGLSRKIVSPSSHRDRDSAPIHVLAEDGENEARKPLRDNKISRASKAEERLGSLLAQPRPDKPILPPETPGVKSKSSVRDFAPITLDGQIDLQTYSNTIVLGTTGGAAEDPHKKPKQNTARHQANKPIPYNISANSDQLSATKCKKPTGSRLGSPGKITAFPRKDPIRTWPKADLRREHFKPNPSHSSGYSYAYREVIRKHDERRCLPGCTRSDCCGDMVRKMLAIGGPIVPNGSTREDPQKKGAVDHSLLEDYMGDNYRNWRKMTEQEKENEWGKAQEWDFGRRYGRHKDNGRQSTPPGYWNVDMATTQEKEKQDEEAEMMEREVVETRWREAMRKGGAWVFADE